MAEKYDGSEQSTTSTPRLTSPQLVLASTQQVVDRKVALVKGDEQRRRASERGSRLSSNRQPRAIFSDHGFGSYFFPERATDPSSGHDHDQQQP